jgi:hypothetical protein
VDVSLSALVTGDYATIEIATPPAHGTVRLSGNVAARTAGSQQQSIASITATYTPNPGFAGTDSFAFAAVGPGGRSAPATVTIEVLGAAPVARARTARTGDGQSVSVSLTEGAEGGPFTAATIVSLTPANAATATIVAAGGGYRLDLTAAPHFGGDVVVTYTLSNAFGVSAPATVTLTVDARPDPSADATVRALSDAQAETTRRFARGQVANFMRRTEELHNDGGSAAPRMGLTLNSRDGSGVYRDQRPADAMSSDLAERMRPTSAVPLAQRGTGLPGGGMGTGVGTGVANAAPAPSAPAEDSGPRRNGSVAIWSGGAIDIGTRDATTRRAKVTATTAGLSAAIPATTLQ